MTVENRLIKICGLREVEHAIVAADAGADLLGLIFAPARRQVTPAVAAVITRAVREGREVSPRFVGVFVEPTLQELQAAIETAGLDLVQVHGHFDARAFSRTIPIPMIPAFAYKPGRDVADLETEIDAIRAELGSPWVHIDAYDPVQHGGSGKSADWDVARQLRSTQPVMLAGGLNPENVADAIAAVNPVGVDVSSGVERDGVKNADLIRGFVAAARAAFRHAS